MVGGALREVGCDFQGDFECRVGVAVKDGDDFLGDLHEAGSGCAWSDFDGAVEAFWLGDRR